MVKLICLSLLSTLLLLGCHVGNGDKTNTNSSSIPYELTQPIDARETKAIVMGDKFACFLDSGGHPHCWRNPERFLQSQDPSSRGGFTMDYPKKTNADLAAHKFVNLASDGGVCAVRDDNKVLCFMPDKVISIPTSKLNGLGRFTKVAATALTGFCAIDQSGILSCHNLDFKANTPKDHYVAAEEIKEFTVGDSSKGPFGCWITTSSLLQCELFNRSSVATNGSDDAYKIANGPSDDFSIAKLSSDKKTIRHFGNNQNDAIDEFEEEDRTRLFSEIAVTQDAVICGVFDGTNILRCGGPHSPYAPKRKSDGLEREVFMTIAVSERIGCGLRPDKTISCWHPKKISTGVPAHLKAE